MIIMILICINLCCKMPLCFNSCNSNHYNSFQSLQFLCLMPFTPCWANRIGFVHLKKIEWILSNIHWHHQKSFTEYFSVWDHFRDFKTVFLCITQVFSAQARWSFGNLEINSFLAFLFIFQVLNAFYWMEDPLFVAWPRT